MRDTQERGYLNLLVAAIPTEPLALYTAAVGVVVATIDKGDPDRLGLRWGLYIVGLAFIVAWLGTNYLRGRAADRKRKFPWVETLSAAIAFAAWGLVMPQSPLQAELNGDDRVIWTGLIALGGAALLGLLTGSLKKPAKT